MNVSVMKFIEREFPDIYSDMQNKAVLKFKYQQVQVAKHLQKYLEYYEDPENSDAHTHYDNEEPEMFKTNFLEDLERIF